MRDHIRFTRGVIYHASTGIYAHFVTKTSLYYYLWLLSLTIVITFSLSVTPVSAGVKRSKGSPATLTGTTSVVYQVGEISGEVQR